MYVCISCPDSVTEKVSSFCFFLECPKQVKKRKKVKKKLTTKNKLKWNNTTISRNKSEHRNNNAKQKKYY